MSNDERRHYIQDRVAECERKMKSFILQYYTVTGEQEKGRWVIKKYVKPNKNADPRPDPETCSFEEFFNHNQFVMYFSSLKLIIYDYWRFLGKGLESKGLEKERFKIYMEDLNAGRSDADHYDAEDMNGPDDWEISEDVLTSFMLAYNAFKKVFGELGYAFDSSLL